MSSQNTTVVKSLTILNLFLEHDRLTLNEMVHLTNSPKTSVFRMVKSLEQMGFLDKDETGKYSLGLLFLQFGHLVRDRLSIRQVALPVMQKLRDQVGEAVNLIVRDHFEAVYVEKVDTIHPVRIYNEHPGRRVPMYAGACPRILLSFMSKAEQETYFRNVVLLPIGRGTITDVGQLRAALDAAKDNGYTVSHSELQDDTSAVAAPIFDHAGDMVAGLSIAGLSTRFGDDVLPSLIERVKEAARQCSSLLGYQVTPVNQFGAFNTV
ncbi:IclR family transcriptional regulator [Alicyclobacillus fastidiosus]|uniref:IclR family transcriptional regulator n=1 Tax=Alicyclobacillus fastidiosus TaxID=392011 RepID=A0ABV5AEJ0_9BACL|nr:IclR family transcriptional regulator [Alicyclobacillus fastidiosus]WEH09824.1 IclR family transcriptional regulator [Alicyclobacillus fastidiosus]